MTGPVSPGTRPGRPSTGYYLALAAAMLGAVCLAVAVDGTRRVLAGGEGLDAMNAAGLPALAVAWLLAFYARLAFSDRLGASTRNLVRQSLRAVMAGEVVAAVIGSWFVLGSRAATGDLVGILAVADLMQVGTIAWVARYYRE